MAENMTPAPSNDDPKPAFYTAFGRRGTALPQYAANSEPAVVAAVLAVARNEGFKGTGEERMRDLGWSVKPVYDHPASPVSPVGVEPDDDTTTKAQYRRMFAAACADLGRINEALGLDPEDGGADPILDAIEELRATPAAPAAEINPADFITEIIPGDGQKTIGFIHKIHSGVRLTHKPTGITTESTTERSSHANRAIAWELMEEKLKEQPAAVAVGEREALSEQDKADLLQKIRDWSPALHPENGYMISPEGAFFAFEKFLKDKASAALATIPEVCRTCSGHGLIGGFVGGPDHGGYDSEPCPGCNQPAKAEVQAEPVAYLWQHGETGRTRVVFPDAVFTTDANWRLIGPLYLSPQATQQDARTNFLTQIEDSGEGLRYELNCLVNDGINTFNVYDEQKEEFISGAWNTDPIAAIDAAIQAAQQGGSEP